MRTRSRINFGIAIICVFLASCDRTKVYESYTQIPSGGWSFNDTLEFEFEMNPEADQSYNWLIGLRNNNDYRYSNVFFFVQTLGPNGLQKCDTLQYLLAAPNGKWLGSGVGSIKYNLFNYKASEEMMKGEYTIQITHGMRDKVLVGLEDIGVRIEEFK